MTRTPTSTDPPATQASQAQATQAQEPEATPTLRESITKPMLAMAALGLILGGLFGGAVGYEAGVSDDVRPACLSALDHADDLLLYSGKTIDALNSYLTHGNPALLSADMEPLPDQARRARFAYDLSADACRNGMPR